MIREFPKGFSWGFTFLIIGAVSVFTYLGLWQLDRQQETDYALSLLEDTADATFVPYETTGEPKKLQEIHKVRVRGKLYGRPQYYLFPRVAFNKRGGHIISPLHTDDDRLVLVNFGWREDPMDQALPDMNGITLYGYRVAKERHQVGKVQNNPDKEEWHHIDLEEMQADIWQKHPNLKDKPIDGVLYLHHPQMADIHPIDLRSFYISPHFNYAMTWFLVVAVIASSYFYYLWQCWQGFTRKKSAKKQ